MVADHFSTCPACLEFVQMSHRCPVQEPYNRGYTNSNVDTVFWRRMALGLAFVIGLLSGALAWGAY